MGLHVYSEVMDVEVFYRREKNEVSIDNKIKNIFFYWESNSVWRIKVDLIAKFEKSTTHQHSSKQTNHYKAYLEFFQL